MTGVCELRGRERDGVQGHHLIPRTLHSNKRIKLAFSKETLLKTVRMCRPCHRQIHDFFTEKALGWHYNTIAKLKAHPEVQKWIAWVSTKEF